jgi:hypothetical protein
MRKSNLGIIVSILAALVAISGNAEAQWKPPRRV